MSNLAEWKCLECNETLYLVKNKFDETKLLICPKCNYKHTTLHCPHCNSDDFFDEFTNNPSSWVCEKCGQTVNFPDGFYLKPYYFIAKENVRNDIRKKVSKDKELTKWIIINIVCILGSIGIVVVITLLNR
ncbi:MAG TPA: hypothetical protein VHY08_06530 [Bacillota bacterium]|nr:hypothetical protein [Bacillota bacterium]